MARVHTFALATRSGRTESPSIVVPANVKRVALTVSLDLATIQDPATQFTIGVEWLAPDGVTWRQAAQRVDGVPSLVLSPDIHIGLTVAPGDTVRAFLDSVTPLAFSATVDTN